MKTDISLKHISIAHPLSSVNWNDEHKATQILFKYADSNFHLSILWECCSIQGIKDAAANRIQKSIEHEDCLESLCATMTEIHSGSYITLRKFQKSLCSKIYALGNSGQTCHPQVYRLALRAINDLEVSEYMQSLISKKAP